MISFNNGLQPGGRRPRLWLTNGVDVVKFYGTGNGLATIIMESFAKNGKWSNTSYSLKLNEGVRALEFLSPLHGVWGQELQSWKAVSDKLGLSVDLCKEIISAEYPATAERLDAIDNEV